MKLGKPKWETITTTYPEVKIYWHLVFDNEDGSSIVYAEYHMAKTDGFIAGRKTFSTHEEARRGAIEFSINQAKKEILERRRGIELLKTFL